MKTATQLKKSLIILLVLIGQTTFSQRELPVGKKYGYSSEILSPANGHGIFYAINLDIYKGNNVFSFGPTIQKRTMQIKGFKLSFSRNLSKGLIHAPIDELEEETYPAEQQDLGKAGEDVFERFQLNFLSSFQYNDKLPLSYKLIRDEEKMQRGEPAINFRDLKFATAEFTLGFSLQLNITRNLAWKNYIGSSIYYHLNYCQGMDHERLAPVLNLGTGISILVDRVKKH